MTTPDGVSSPAGAWAGAFAPRATMRPRPAAHPAQLGGSPRRLWAAAQACELLTVVALFATMLRGLDHSPGRILLGAAAVTLLLLTARHLTRRAWWSIPDQGRRPLSPRARMLLGVLWCYAWIGAFIVGVAAAGRLAVWLGLSAVLLTAGMLTVTALAAADRRQRLTVVAEQAAPVMTAAAIVVLGATSETRLAAAALLALTGSAAALTARRRHG